MRKANQLTGNPAPSNPNQSGKSLISPPANRVRTRLAGWLLYAYATALVVALVLIRIVGEHWWVATLILFGPRWIYAVPLVVIGPLFLFMRRRLLWLLGASVICLVFPVMGLCLPWRTLFTPESTRMDLRMVTCNIHRHMLDAVAMAQFLGEARPDLIVFQEWSSSDQAGLFSDPSWYLRRDGELMLASRYPIQSAVDIARGRWGVDGSAVCYQLLTPTGVVRIINLHLASPHIMFADALHRGPDAPAAISGNCRLRREQSALISQYAGSSLLTTLIAGDFNSPTDSSTFQSGWSGFTDSFSIAGTGFGETYYARWTRTRIDHILFSTGLHCRRCSVGPDVGSPHRPLFAEFQAVSH